MYVKVGTYTGNGTSQSFTGFGFAPVTGLIKRSGSTNVCCQIIKTGGVTHSKYLGANAAVNDTRLTLDADGFSLISTNDAEINAGTATYEYVMWGGDGTVDFAVFEYAGDTTDGRSVGSFTFTPNMAWVLPSSTTRAMWRSDQVAGDASQRFDSTTTTNNIEGFGAGSITVGTALNAAATSYYVAVWKTAASVFALTEYTGDGVDDRNVAHGLGTTPIFVYVQSQTVTAQPGWMWFTGDGSTSHPVTAAADGTNSIQAVDGTNVQVGTDAGVNSATSSPVYTLVTFGLATASASRGLMLLGVGT